MNGSLGQDLLVMDESLFYRLLEEDGTVQVDIARLGQYFVPYVSHVADDPALCVQYGAIVRNRKDLLAAESVDDLVDLLRDMAGQFASLKINHPGTTEMRMGPH